MTNEQPGARATRAALVVFVAVEVVALPVLLRLGHDRWFQYDEWDFLATRTAWNVHDLFRPHAVHWSTLPILAYRAQWQMWGLRSYVPYQVVSVVVHLVVAALVRAVMRRAGVRPWTATALAILLVFLGSGEENIAWAFQIGFTGALAFGLGHLILADHDGPIDRRDWLGLLAGLAGLLCSGVAVAMVLVVGAAALLRRGWLAAVFHTVPLGVVYAIWYLAIGRTNSNASPGSLSATLRFMRKEVVNAFQGLAQLPWLGWALALFIVVGLVLAWRGLPRDELRRTAAAPAALLAGAFAFLLITAIGRSGFTTDISHATRFVYIASALMLPAIAVAADAFLRRWRAATPILAIILLASLVGNIHAFSDKRAYSGAFLRSYRKALLAMPRADIAASLPKSLPAEPTLAPGVTIGWLRAGVASGRIPSPGALTAQDRLTVGLQLALRKAPGLTRGSCRRYVGNRPNLRVPEGSSLWVDEPGQLWFTQTDENGVTSRFVIVGVAPSRPIRAYATLSNLQVAPVTSDKTFEICQPRA